MDIATILGLAMAVLAMTLALFGDYIIAPETIKQYIRNEDIAPFVHVPSIGVVFGGSLAAVLICFPLSRIVGILGVLKNCFFNKPENVAKIIEQIVSLAEVARREGLLALESKLDDVDHPFVQLGIQMAIDGSPPDVIEDLLRTEINAVATRHADGKAVVEQLGRFAPAFGMIGTLIGLVLMLRGLADDPDGIGSKMAIALITTLYGAILSNGLFLPLAEKLAVLNKQELRSKEIILRGILSIQSGENPRVIDQKLQTYLPPKLRQRESNEVG